MANTLSENIKESGKLRHSRLITIATIISTFIGVVIAGIFIYNTADSAALFNEQTKMSLIVILVSGALLYLGWLNSKLIELEKVLGWDESLEQRKIRKAIKSIFSSIVNLFGRNADEFDYSLQFLVSAFISLYAAIFIYLTFTPGLLGLLNYYLGITVALVLGIVLLLIAVLGMLAGVGEDTPL